MKITRCRPRRDPLLVALLLAMAPLAHAADTHASVDAGDASAPAAAAPAPQDTPPAAQVQALPEPKMAAPATFVLQRVEFTGATGVPDAELQATAAGLVGREVSFADLEAVARRATAVYQRHGYGLVQVFLPVQEVVDGTVRFSVVEGSLGAVTIDVQPGAPIGRERVAGTLAILEPGKPLNSRKYERAMLLLSDLPGIKPQSAVSVGTAGGVSDLRVEVAPRNRLMYALELDNFGTRDSGRHRLTGSLRWASPTGRGDNLDLRLMVAEGMHTAFGRLSYETPVGYDGLRIGGGIARVQYELGGAFAALEPTGVGNVADLSFSYPVIRQRTTNVFLRGSLDRKSLIDRFEAVGYETRKRIEGGALGMALEHRDKWLGGGYTSANAQLYHGRLSLRDAMGKTFDQPPYGYGTEGSFGKFTLQAARLQYIAPKLSLYVGGGMQRASKNLDTYEKLSLGGPKAVRAYATGEVLVDDGWLATAELRFAFRPEATLFAFFDAAHGDTFHRRRAFDGSLAQSLRGHGVGFNWTKPGKVSMNLSVAWRDTRAGLTDGGDRNPRLYWSIQKAF